MTVNNVHRIRNLSIVLTTHYSGIYVIIKNKKKSITVNDMHKG